MRNSLTTKSLGKVKEMKRGYIKCESCGCTSFTFGGVGKIANLPFHRYVCDYCGDVRYIHDKLLIDLQDDITISHNNHKLLT